jgi:SHS2 domain-containing protein
VNYRVIDHTADFGIEVFSQTPETLFADAGLALFDLITETEKIEPTENLIIEIGGEDREDLMVNWLRRLLSLWHVQELLVRRTRIENLSTRYLKARIEAEAFDPARHPIKKEIKAVTYHRIHVQSDAGIWMARIIFDV